MYTPSNNRSRLLTLTMVCVCIGLGIAFVQTANGATHEKDSSVESVIVASTANYPDALIAAAPAAKLDMPVLLTKKDSLPAETTEALERMSPKAIITIGGDAVISDSVTQSLTEYGNVTELWAGTRYGTAAEVAEHFWIEGTEEALVVQNNFSDDGDVLAAAKELARSDEMPVFVTPPDAVPARVLTALDDLGVSSVDVVGTQVTDTYTQSLTDIGISIDETFSGNADMEVRQQVEQAVRSNIPQGKDLLIVASQGRGAQHSIAAAHIPNTAAVHVTESSEISDMVSLVQNKQPSGGQLSVTVAGQPQLAQEVADALRNQTEAQVRLTVAQAANALSINTNITQGAVPAFAQGQDNRMQQWQQSRQQNRDRIRNQLNESLQQAAGLMDSNASQRARTVFQKAQTAFANGNLDRAQARLRAARNAVQEQRWEQARGNGQQFRRMVRDEVESLQQKVDGLRQINQAFAQQMRQNLSPQERLAVIEQFQNKRQAQVRQIAEQAQQMGGPNMIQNVRKAQRAANRGAGPGTPQGGPDGGPESTPRNGSNAGDGGPGNGMPAGGNGY